MRNECRVENRSSMAVRSRLGGVSPVEGKSSGNAGQRMSPVRIRYRNSVMPTPYSYQSSNLEPMMSTKPSSPPTGTTHRHRSPLSVDPHTATDAAARSESARGATGSNAPAPAPSMPLRGSTVGLGSSICARTDQNEAVRSRTLRYSLSCSGAMTCRNMSKVPTPYTDRKCR